ncbi:MAG: hypothetical protein KF789_12350 [Bdellovibrionaceae bacterium]|nr:hypothetical protein [Pseudobdellovibrionaceae bacterium]
MKNLMMAACLALSFGFATAAHAEETMGEKAKETWQDTKKNAKKAWRNAKGEWCEMVNGKAECVMKRAKAKVQNAVDEGKDKLNVDQ